MYYFRIFSLFATNLGLIVKTAITIYHAFSELAGLLAETIRFGVRVEKWLKIKPSTPYIPIKYMFARVWIN